MATPSGIARSRTIVSVVLSVAPTRELLVINSHDDLDTSGIKVSTRPAGVRWEAKALLKTAEKSTTTGIAGSLIAVANISEKSKCSKFSC